MDFLNIALIAHAHANKWTAKQLVVEIASLGYDKHDAINELSALIPEANNGLNSGCVKLICNAIKQIAA